MDGKTFKEAYRDAMHTDTEARSGKSTLQAAMRARMDSSETGAPIDIADWLGDLKTEFEQDIARENKECKAQKRKVFQARIADINRTCKKEYGLYFKPVNRPRGDKAHTERWNYDYAAYEPKEKPEPVLTCVIGADEVVVSSAQYALFKAVYESVTESAATAVNVIMNYHTQETVGKEVARVLMELAKESENEF